MISEHDALSRILANIATLPSREIPLRQALGLFSAANLSARIPLPPFDNSAMDGYAVIAAEAAKGIRLRIVGEQPAGVSRNLRVSPGEATRIFTGAPIPEGADAVVMQEETERDGEFVRITAQEIKPGEFVRKAGADLAIGQQIIGQGDQLTPARLALLASQGFASVEAHQRARVAVITTGDEIVPHGAQPQKGEIYDSNGVMLSALAERAGAQVTDQFHCRDNLPELCARLETATGNDIVMIAGGVSVGERDLVREALRRIGGEIDLWRVALKPGKPFLFGKRKQCAIFGLPGNPVSSFVTFLIFVRPALARMMGAKKVGGRTACARLAHEVTGDDTRPHYLRGKLSGEVFSITGPQESHALFGLARSDALLRVNPGETLAAGSLAEVLLA